MNVYETKNAERIGLRSVVKHLNAILADENTDAKTRVEAARLLLETGGFVGSRFGAVTNKTEAKKDEDDDFQNLLGGSVKNS